MTRTPRPARPATFALGATAVTVGGLVTTLAVGGLLIDEAGTSPTASAVTAALIAREPTAGPTSVPSQDGPPLTATPPTNAPASLQIPVTPRARERSVSRSQHRGAVLAPATASRAVARVSAAPHPRTTASATTLTSGSHQPPPTSTHPEPDAATPTLSPSPDSVATATAPSSSADLPQASTGRVSAPASASMPPRQQPPTWNKPGVHSHHQTEGSRLADETDNEHRQ